MVHAPRVRQHADLGGLEGDTQRVRAADDELVVARELREDDGKVVATHEVALATARRQKREVLRVASRFVPANLFEEKVEELFVWKEERAESINY